MSCAGSLPAGREGTVVSGPLEETPCNACGSAEAAILFEREGTLHVEESFVATTDLFQGYGRVVKCRGCGLVRLSPRQAWSFLRQAYRESKDPPYLDESRGRRDSARRVLRFIERTVKSGDFLDVGSGVGILLSVASGRWRVKGVELCSWAAATARERYGLEVFEGTLNEARFPDASFDVVTMLDVIEHLPDPKEVVAEVARILKPGGALFVLTPDIEAPVSRLMGAWWWGLRPAHLYYFSRRSLSALLRDAGLQVEQVRHWGRKFSLGYWIGRMRGYGPMFPFVGGIVNRLGLGSWPVHINTFDSVAVLATKKAP